MLVILGLSTSVWAFPLENSGEYMFNVKGNDPSSASKDPSDLEAQIKKWFLENKNMEMDINLEFYAKVDQGSSFTTTEGAGGLTLTYENRDSGGKWGTWQTTDAIDFYSVKAGNGYAMYWVDSSATSGTWDTQDRSRKDISHLSTWRNVVNTPPVEPEIPAAVPEPSTLFLIAGGLIGLVALQRKRGNK